MALLSWFDGIATARYVLHSLDVEVVFFLSYEVDPVCNDLAAALWPGALQRGDFHRDSAEDIARTCHGHPGLPESVKEAALGVAGRAIHI